MISPTTFRSGVRAEDRELVRQIVSATGYFSPSEIAVAVELVDEFLVKGAASGYQFIFAERGGRTLGYACFGHIAVTTHSFDLYWVAVRPEFQKEGIGRALVRQAEAAIASQGGKRVYAETSSREQYGPTRAFYERCGYKVDAVQDEFYGPGDGKVVYAKVLS
ncbi:MAG: GNAT family N-acetyltransferase [Planctomycetia bacterium]|nr:GNAT family N-acetyltransferase [Planctomycetia bacterium]